MCSQSDDGDLNTDPRMMFVPSRTYDNNSQRMITFDTPGCPRCVGEQRGDDYSQ